MTARTIDFATASRLHASTRSRSGSTVATALICDTALLRTGLEHLLAGSPFTLTRTLSAIGPGLVGAGAEAPALIIVAANQFASRMAEIIRQAKEQFPHARIVALADQFDLGCVRQAHEAGTEGFYLSTMGREALITSLELVMLGEGVLPAALVGAILNERSASPAPKSQLNRTGTALPPDPKAQRLSTREAEILRCLTQGEPNKVIARKFDVAEATVKVHVKAILRKIGAANRIQAAMWASQRLPRKGVSDLNV
jgi:two-component system, NarL family, nitrate/nitrite response regulator NarL